MSRNILAVSLAVLFVNIQLSSANVAVEVERIIEELKAVDFQATSSQRPYVILRDLVKNIVAKSPAERENFADAFSEKGGVDELIRWMDYVDQQNTNNHSDYQDKSCAAKLMQILFHGTNHPTFCDRMISSGMVEKFLPLVFKDQLFADADFTSDFFLLGLKTLDTLDIGSLAFELHRIMRKLFGDDLSVLQARFQSETSMVHKLLLAVALVQRSFSEFSQAELERMSIDPGILLRIRDDLLARVESLHSDPHYTYDYTLRTNFMGWQIPFSPATLLRYFTPLLLSDSNRVALCDQQTFNYYFIGVDLWARDIIKKDELHGLTMYSLRGLQILCQTCPHFKTYFQEFQTNQLEKVKETMDSYSSSRHASIQREAESLWGMMQRTTQCPKEYLIFTLTSGGIQCVCRESPTENVETTGKMVIKTTTPRRTWPERTVSTRKKMVTLGSPVVGKKPDETTQKPEIAINLVVVVGAIIGATLGIAGFAALVTAGLRKRRMFQQLPAKPEPLAVFTPNMDDIYTYIDSNEPRFIPEIHSQYIDMESNIENPLGIGRFGKVFKGNFKFFAVSMTVAVKTINDDMENTQALETEGQLMSRMKPHVNVIKLLAMTRDARGQRQLILEYCELGSLQSLIPKFEINYGVSHYLPSKCGEIWIISVGYLHALAYQIADGMAFMANEKLYHKDLAARNILINDSFVAKLCDFGLTRYSEGVYFSKSWIPTPKETAPEALTHLIYTEFSDVYSFGILLLNLFDLSPYTSDQTIKTAKETPRQLPKPSHADDETHQMILRCLDIRPAHRPQFSDLRRFFKSKVPREMFGEMLEVTSQEEKKWKAIEALLKKLNSSSTSRVNEASV